MGKLFIEQMPQVKNENLIHLERYVKFINSRPERDLVKDGQHFNIHHIIPRALSGSNESCNLIKLTHREHYIAHLILWKAYHGKMACAFWWMSNQHTSNSRYYEKLGPEVREFLFETLKNRIVVNNGSKMLHVNNDEIPNGFVIGSLHKVTQYNKQSYSDFFSKSKWITDGSINHRINKDEKIPECFYIGKTEHCSFSIKKSEATKQKIWINDGVKNKRINRDDEIPNNYTIGMLQQKVPSANIGTIWITNGLLNKKIKNYENLPDGFTFGKTLKNFNGFKIKRHLVNNGKIQMKLKIEDQIPSGFILGGLKKCQKQ